VSRQRIAIVLQARRSSRRLPAKALAHIGEATLLEHCLHRLILSRVGEVMLATTEAPEDDELAQLATRMGVRTFRGSTNDVLGRYMAAAQLLEADVVIRATGDNPAVDIDAPARVLRALREASADYACEDGLPLGAGVEALTMPTLWKAAAAARSPEDREHVTLFVKRYADVFRVVRAEAPQALARSELRFTVDTPEDLDYMRRLFAQAGRPEPGLDELIAAADAAARSDAA
jgi:spore coat polysaccharide biosynthesis protein SpsF (cytidylyltransferase family)